MIYQGNLKHHYLIPTAQKIAESINRFDSTKIKNKPAIIYDIDDTLIDIEGHGIMPIIATYKYAVEKGLTPIIITARPYFPYNVEHTLNQLKNHGIDFFESIYFMDDGLSPDLYKHKSREHVKSRGFDIYASVGDRLFDLHSNDNGFLVNHYRME